MHRTGPLRRRWSPLLVILTAASTMSCRGTLVVAKPDIPAPEVVVAGELGDFLRTRPKPVLVLRAHRPSTSFTAETPAAADEEVERAYHSIEKRFLAAGFTLRDRRMVEELLDGSRSGAADRAAVDYKGLRDRLDADLVVEISSMRGQPFDTRNYVVEKTGEPGTLTRGEFSLSGWRLDATVTRLDNGSVVAKVTTYSAPQGRFLLRRGKVSVVDEQGRPTAAPGWVVGLQEGALAMAAELEALLTSR